MHPKFLWHFLHPHSVDYFNGFWKKSFLGPVQPACKTIFTPSSQGWRSPILVNGPHLGSPDDVLGMAPDRSVLYRHAF